MKNVGLTEMMCDIRRSEQSVTRDTTRAAGAIYPLLMSFKGDVVHIGTTPSSRVVDVDKSL